MIQRKVMKYLAFKVDNYYSEENNLIKYHQKKMILSN